MEILSIGEKIRKLRKEHIIKRVRRGLCFEYNLLGEKEKAMKSFTKAYMTNN